MAVPTLFNLPKSPEDWNVWSFAHRTSHKKITAAIFAKGGANLTNYIVDPIDFNDTEGFLGRNQRAHIEMNSALKLSSTDLQDVDLTDENQLRAWVFNHAKEHESAENALGV